MELKKMARVALAILIATLFIIVPLSRENTAFAKESSPRDWDRLTSGGRLRSSATETSYCVMLDAHTGKVLHEENANSKRYPASITKIMTCLVILENCDINQHVTIGDVNIKEDGAKKLGLRKGELLKVEDLLYGLMLQSGNDAGVALANYAAGSVEKFAEMMNAKAEEIGMTGTRFVNPHGLHDSKHYTTAMDMARLAYVAMQNPTFRKIVGTYRYTPPVTNKHNVDNPWYPKVWQNSNRLISTSDKETFAFNDSNGHAIGIKTGYTRAASGTLVSAAVSKDGTQEVITVVLYDPNTPHGKWRDTITMFMYGFDFYDTINLSKYLTSDLTITAHVENAASSVNNENLEMLLVPQKNNYLTDTTSVIQAIKDNPDSFTRVDEINTLIAPIKKDEEVGIAKFYLDGGVDPVLACTLIAGHDVDAIPMVTPEPTATPEPNKPENTPSPSDETGVVGYLGYGLLGVVGILLVITFIIMIRRKAKYHQYNASIRGRHRRK